MQGHFTEESGDWTWIRVVPEHCTSGRRPGCTRVQQRALITSAACFSVASLTRGYLPSNSAMFSHLERPTYGNSAFTVPRNEYPRGEPRIQPARLHAGDAYTLHASRWERHRRFMLDPTAARGTIFCSPYMLYLRARRAARPPPERPWPGPAGGLQVPWAPLRRLQSMGAGARAAGRHTHGPDFFMGRGK